MMQAFVTKSKHTVKRFPAVRFTSDDQVLPLLSLRARADFKRERVQHEALHGRGAVGCAVSHFSVWTEFLQSDAQVCCVLEDDVHPKWALDFDTSIASMLKRQDTWDIALLGWCGSLPSLRADGTLKVFPESKGFVGAHAYMLTRHAAQTLTQQFFPLEMQVDFALQAIASVSGLRVRASHTKFRQTWTGSDVFTFCLLCEPNAVYAVIACLALTCIVLVHALRTR